MLFDCALLLFGVVVIGGLVWVAITRFISAQRFTQPQSPIANTTSVMERVGKGFVIVLKILAVLVVLLVVSAIFSCGCNCINWSQEKAMEARLKVENLEKQFDEEASQREAERERIVERETIAEEERVRFEEVNVGGWLSSHYANGWTNLNPRLRRIGKDNEKSLVFPITPYAGTHLPPLDLTLAPAGTMFLVDDKEFAGGISGRDLWAVYPGHDEARSYGRVSITNDASYSPSLLVKTEYSNGDPQVGSVCTLTVQYPDARMAQLDGNTRICLERVIKEEDLERPIKVMDLPSVIDGVPVSWDMVIRCYPAWETDPDTNIGRWMPSPDLDSVYLYHHSPVMLISHDADESEEVKESSGDSFVPPPFPRTTVTSGLSEVLRDVVESVFSEFTEVSSEEFIWWDSQNLLNKGVLMTSSEDMIARIYSWRDVNGYDANEWKGGESLHLFVKKFPDRFASDASVSVGVTVRVILRVRLRAFE